MARNRVAPDIAERVEGEIDIEEIDLGKVLLGKSDKKKKPKAKAKPKKPKVDPDSGVSRTYTIPLSMQTASAEDVSQFEARCAAAKNAVNSAKPYNASNRYAIGDVMNHKSFGVGFVVADGGLNKVEVLFKGGRKLLVMGVK